MGASTKKWTTLDPCLGLNESNPDLCTTFEFYEIEIHKHLENICIYKANQFMLTKKNQTTYIYFTRWCCGEQVGDIQKIMVKNLIKI